MVISQKNKALVGYIKDTTIDTYLNLWNTHSYKEMGQLTINHSSWVYKLDLKCGDSQAKVSDVVGKIRRNPDLYTYLTLEDMCFLQSLIEVVCTNTPLHTNCFSYRDLETYFRFRLRGFKLDLDEVYWLCLIISRIGELYRFFKGYKILTMDYIGRDIRVAEVGLNNLVIEGNSILTKVSYYDQLLLKREVKKVYVDEVLDEYVVKPKQLYYQIYNIVNMGSGNLSRRAIK